MLDRGLGLNRLGRMAGVVKGLLHLDQIEFVNLANEILIDPIGLGDSFMPGMSARFQILDLEKAHGINTGQAEDIRDLGGELLPGRVRKLDDNASMDEME